MTLPRLVRHFGGYFAGRILPALITVLAVSVYTRLLDPASVGLYALLASIALFAAVAFYWVRVAMLRTLGSTLVMEPALARTVVISFAATALALAIVEVVALAAWGRFSTTAVALTVAATVANGWFELTITVLQAKRAVGAYGALNVTRAVGTVLGSLGCIAAGLKGEGLLLGFALGNATALLAVGQWAPALSGAFDRALFRRLLHFGWPITATGVLTQLNVTFDRLLLGVTAGTAAVGIYSVAFDFSRQSVYLLISATALAGQPLAMRLLDTDGVEAARAQLRQNARLMLGLAIPAVGGLVVLAGPIAHTFFGSHFQTGAETIIALAAVATALYGLRTFYFDQAFELSRRTRPAAVISAAAAIVAIVCSLTLIPRYGAYGAASSSLISNALGVGLSAVWGRRFFPLPLAAGWWQAGAATFGMIAVLVLIPVRVGVASLALACTAAVIAYGALYAIASRASRAGFAHALGARLNGPLEP